MKINGVTISGGSTPTILTSQTLASGSWSLSGDYYQYTFSNAGIDTTKIVSFTPDNTSVIEVTTCGMLPQINTTSGGCVLFSQFPPQSNIVGTFSII